MVARTETIASQDQEAALIMKCSHEILAVPLLKINHVVEVDPQQIIPVPRSPHFVSGIINHWGKIITVIDLVNILEIKDKIEPSQLMPILILDFGKKHLGLLVNNIVEIVNSAVIEKRSENESDKTLLSEKVVIGDKSVDVLSVDNLLKQLKLRFEAIAQD